MIPRYSVSTYDRSLGPRCAVAGCTLRCGRLSSRAVLFAWISGAAAEVDPAAPAKTSKRSMGGKTFLLLSSRDEPTKVIVIAGIRVFDCRTEMTRGNRVDSSAGKTVSPVVLLEKIRGGVSPGR